MIYKIREMLLFLINLASIISFMMGKDLIAIYMILFYISVRLTDIWEWFNNEKR